jgi:hypothetical protein
MDAIQTIEATDFIALLDGANCVAACRAVQPVRLPTVCASPPGPRGDEPDVGEPDIRVGRF